MFELYYRDEKLIILPLPERDDKSVSVMTCEGVLLNMTCGREVTIHFVLSGGRNFNAWLRCFFHLNDG